MRKAVKLPLSDDTASLVYLWNNCAQEMKDNDCDPEEMEFAKHYFFLGAESLMIALVSAAQMGWEHSDHAEMILKEIDKNISRPDDEKEARNAGMDDQ